MLTICLARSWCQGNCRRHISWLMERQISVAHMPLAVPVRWYTCDTLTVSCSFSVLNSSGSPVVPFQILHGTFFYVSYQIPSVLDTVFSNFVFLGFSCLSANNLYFFALHMSVLHVSLLHNIYDIEILPVFVWCFGYYLLLYINQLEGMKWWTHHWFSCI